MAWAVLEFSKTQIDAAGRLLAAEAPNPLEVRHALSVLNNWRSAHSFPLNTFGHYFRNLYHVFAFIDRSELSSAEKLQYAKIVRAQLSTAEVVLLFANALTEQGAAFEKFITKYALFEHAAWPAVWWRYRSAFPEDAYGETTESKSV